jgi:hypothetical protein
VNNTTLLHFLERTVAKHFPHMDEFLEELAKPAEAYRGMNPVEGLVVNILNCTSESSESSRIAQGTG